MPPAKAPYQVLCLGAHADDIEIGCGGTVLKLLNEIKEISFSWVVFSAQGEREKEALKSAQIFLEKAQSKNIVIKNFREAFFPYIGGDIKEFFEQMKQELSPDLILTHYRNDRHQDHRLISELTWNTFRDHLILEYEILKYDGDMGSPNFFMELSKSLGHRKIKNILDIFKTQQGRHWFSQETFLSLLSLRAVEAKTLNNYAEAFYCRKIVF
jgi:LmbE family N-acetylglucosaminyl deacetylase